ncbi:DUF982 domain-containing protein [Neorhizobium alkalisoli]|jgi:hypothetical protein|uniref:DUF982 domain-containing protein n=1 Tax=Neorhizobium alkalisoli TaxID=528178 RepID=UPI001FEEDFF4|nr:DUF982 domain-containing protein [Neorhizobium alkalisoli]
MGKIISVSFNLTWARPVYVGDAERLDTTIEGPADAIRWMRYRFKFKQGTAYWRAQTLCHSALLQEVHQDFARQPFFDAWLEESHL